jgi:hypothetical protein
MMSKYVVGEVPVRRVAESTSYSLIPLQSYLQPQSLGIVDVFNR